MESEECVKVIEEAWSLVEVSMGEKLNECAAHLRGRGAKKYGAIFKELRTKRKKLKNLNKGNITAAQLQQRPNFNKGKIF